MAWTAIRIYLSHAGISVSSKIIKGRSEDSCRSADGIGRLHIIRGTLYAIQYIDIILVPKLLPSIRDIATKNASFIFQQDFAPCLTSGLAIHQNDHQARRRFVEWAQNKIAVVPDFHKQILFSDEAHFRLNGYANKQNCRIWSETNPQMYIETPLHPEKLTVWCVLWAGGILLQK
ncbi:uncharacterized protein TNCV_4726641 [Trichonephila clavipes]|nr:uncharacterized protein TNCV_4726641 [Trichonephila clavipes]